MFSRDFYGEKKRSLEMIRRINGFTKFLFLARFSLRKKHRKRINDFTQFLKMKNAVDYQRFHEAVVEKIPQGIDFTKFFPFINFTKNIYKWKNMELH